MRCTISNLILTSLVYIVHSILAQSVALQQAIANTTYEDTEFPVISVGRARHVLYFVNASFGDPPQMQVLSIDITQPFTWVLSEAGFHSVGGAFGSSVWQHPSSLYDANDSSSALVLNGGEGYQIQFVEGMWVNGTAVCDRVNFTNINIVNDYHQLIENTDESALINGVSITKGYLSLLNMSFIDANSSSYPKTAILGLGSGATILNQHADGLDASFYFLRYLKSAEIIEAESYSLWLYNDTMGALGPGNDTDTSARVGVLLLGAVNPALYMGPLYEFSMIPYLDPISNVAVKGYPIFPMGAIYVRSRTGQRLNMTSENFWEPVLLDSTSNASYLPQEAIIQIAIQLGATYVEALDRWLVPCEVGSLDASLEFTFDGLSINVPVEDILITARDMHTNATLHFANNVEACYLMLFPSAELGFNLLGRSFLRNTYLVMDLEGESLAIAQADNAFFADPYPYPSSSSSSTTVKGKATLVGVNTVPTQPTIAAIRPGKIPYATFRNVSHTTLILNPTRTASLLSSLANPFTVTIDSDGLISSYGRSFYDTTLSSSSSRSSSDTVQSLSITKFSEVATTTSRSGPGIHIKSDRGALILDPRSNAYILWGIAVILISMVPVAIYL